MKAPLLRWSRLQLLPQALRKPSVYLIWGGFACLVLRIPSTVAQGAAPAEELAEGSHGRISLQGLLDRFENTAAPVVKKAHDMLTLVDAEASAQRISEPIAVGLRWTIRSLLAPEGAEPLALLDSARLPEEDSAVMEAALALDHAERAAQAKRVELKGLAIREFVQRSGELVGDATSIVEIDAFLVEIERFQTLTKKFSDDNASRAPNLAACIALMRSLRDLIAAAPSHDFGPEGQFMRNASVAREFAPVAAYSKRVSAILASFQQEADAVRDEFGAALLAGRSEAQISALAGNLVDATNRYSTAATALAPDLRNWGYGLIATAAYRPYLAIDNVSELIASHQWGKARAEIASARKMIPQIPSNQADAAHALLTKLERQISERMAAASRAFREELHEKIGAVKQPADLAALATDLWNRERTLPGAEDSWITHGLTKALSALAAAWGAEDLHLLAGGNQRARSLEGDVDDAGLGPLRDRIEQEIVSRAIDAPDFNPASNNSTAWRSEMPMRFPRCASTSKGETSRPPGCGAKLPPPTNRSWPWPSKTLPSRTPSPVSKPWPKRIPNPQRPDGSNRRANRPNE
jgi:hypothetical protein